MQPGVSDAIVELVEAGRISATSVLVFAADSARSAPLLAARRRVSCSVGLHFTLTEASQWREAMPLSALILRTGLRLLSPAAVRDALRRQLDQFEDLFGAPPEFLDGHEHVHQLPTVRSVVVDFLHERYGATVAVRSTKAAVARGGKARLIETLGGNGLARLAAERGLATNTDFAGVYAFKETGRYRERIGGWLANMTDGGLIMCHPGRDPAADLIGSARHEEYSYLRSAQWPADLDAHAARLIPFRAS
jgi:predicted glycoside hydrolase/deacetylase ChbG (UPF0249 family)